jgi:hypothetical protein
VEGLEPINSQRWREPQRDAYIQKQKNEKVEKVEKEERERKKLDEEDPMAAARDTVGGLSTTFRRNIKNPPTVVVE